MLLFLLLMPIAFSVCFSRLYNQDIYQFFTAPNCDDEAYFDHLNVWFGDHIYSAVSSPRCHVPKNWRGIGSAVFWSPGYLFFKTTGSLLKPSLGMEAMDKDQWLRLGAATSNFFIASAILALVLAILQSYISPLTSIFFSFIIVFGGILPYYLFRRPLMSHAAETLFFFLAAYGIEKMKKAPDCTWAYVLVGLASAGILTTRFQDLPIVAILLAILIWDHKRQGRSLLMLVSVFLASLIPQLIINHVNMGSWILHPSEAVSFLTPVFLIEVGFVQLSRLCHVFFGGDWGLFWMFPWLFFSFFISWERIFTLWPVSSAWIIAPLSSLLVEANWMGHGGSYAHRYIILLVFDMGILAAIGFENLLEKAKRFKILLYAMLALLFLISLTHFVAFESNEHGLTLILAPVAEEGSVRTEWTSAHTKDWVNGQFSRNVYKLFLHPKELVRCFGAAPLPLYVSVKLAQLRHQELSPAIEQYVDKHHIDFRSYWKYMGAVMAGNIFLFLLFFSAREVFGRGETTCHLD